MKSVAVIGAGITGATTAYALMEKGFDVTIIERERYASMVTSFANGGQLSASNTEVWNNWKLILKSLKYLFIKNAPLKISMVPSFHKYKWFYQFISEIKNHDVNTANSMRLALDSREHLLRVAEQENIEFDCLKKGILHIYKNKKEFTAATVGHELMVKAGLKRHKVTNEEIHQIEPAISQECYAGYYTPDDFTGDIYKYTTGLVHAMEAKGVKIKYLTEVKNIVPKDDKVLLKLRGLHTNEFEEQLFDKVVICAGVGSKDLARTVGDKLNIYPVKGYSITINLQDSDLKNAPLVSFLDESAKVVSTRFLPNRLRVAGMADFYGYDLDIKNDRIQSLIEWASQMFPSLKLNNVVPWTGLRPMTPDMLPRIQQTPMKGVYYNTGHGHLGWTFSAITAQMIADLIVQDDKT